MVVREGGPIQAAIDAAEPGSTIQVRRDHAEQVWINKDGIELVGKQATLSMPDEPDFEGPCGPTLICVISRNTSTNGAFGGISIDDVSDVVIDRNTATGNSTIAGPLDINFNGTGSPVTFIRNRREYSAPDASWCTN